LEQVGGVALGSGVKVWAWKELPVVVHDAGPHTLQHDQPTVDPTVDSVHVGRKVHFPLDKHNVEFLNILHAAQPQRTQHLQNREASGKYDDNANLHQLLALPDINLVEEVRTCLDLGFFHRIHTLNLALNEPLPLLEHRKYESGQIGGDCVQKEVGEHGQSDGVLVVAVDYVELVDDQGDHCHVDELPDEDP